ncbi:MAG: nucleotide exchange factor GrpE [Betaproteobacteria bacterium]|nr:nucleotide exchange factor GrpE [Betaproteobacteria bacterium]
MQDNKPTPATSQSEPSAAASREPEGAAATETMPSLEELLRQAELQAKEHYDAWLRAKAETENIRKRSQAEVASAHKFAIEGFASELLAVRDSLEAALQAKDAAVENLRDGVELTLKQLTAVFDKFNVAEVNPVGEKFDPHYHQAMSMVPAEAAPNTVVGVMQKGYRLNDRMLRPALVTIAKAPDA